MKILKFKNLLFSLSILMALSVLITSCNKQSDILDEKIDLSNEELATQLAANSSFIALFDIMKETDKDVSAFILANQTTIEKDMTVLESFMSGYTKNQEAIAEHSIQLYNDFPQLYTEDEEATSKVIVNAFGKLGGLTNSAAVVGSRTIQCHECAETLDAVNALLHRQYVAGFNACIAAGNSGSYCHQVWTVNFFQRRSAIALGQYYFCISRHC